MEVGNLPSFFFSVKQIDKVRRCEDFRRSGHNATVTAFDTPHHHDVRMLAEFGLAQSEESNEVMAFPAVRGTIDSCYCILQTPDGAVVLRHHALTFGSTGSVWCFNQAADGVMFLARRLLAVPICHYVDDFISIEPNLVVDSGYKQFTRLMRVLGAGARSC